MPFLLDTSVAIHLRDGDEPVVARVSELTEVPSLSAPTLIELQGGLGTDLVAAERRIAGIARLRRSYAVYDLDAAVIDHYGAMVRSIGFVRTRVFDRLIAATAIVHDLTLITINGADFRDVPDLKLQVWPSPAQ